MLIQLAFVLVAIIIGARLGGIGLGVLGGLGLAVLTFVFGLELAVIACCEAITAIPSGRSGRIFVSVATSAITGKTE